MSVSAGIGLGGSHLPAVYSIGLYFEKHRYVVTALAFAGGASAVMVASPLTEFLIEHIGWRGTCLINAGFSLQIVIAGAVQRPVHLTGRKEKLTLRDIFALYLFKDLKLTLYTLNTFLWSQGLMIVMVLTIDYAVSTGVSREEAAWLMTTMGICTVAVRLVIAAIGHVPHATRWMFNMGKFGFKELLF